MSEPTKKRWPEFPGWDEKAEAIETVAEACGAHAYCSQKYQYLNVELRQGDSAPEQFKALHEIADMIELFTDRE